MFSLVAYSNDLMSQNQPPRSSRDDSECGNFRYVSLMNRTSSFDSNILPPINEIHTNPAQKQHEPLKRTTSDQALPSMSDNASIESRVFKANDLDRYSRSKSGSKSSQETSLELNVLKCKSMVRDDEQGPSLIDNTERNLNLNLNNTKDRLTQNQTNGQHVPSGSMNNSIMSTSLNALSNSSMGGDDRRNRREINGQLILNHVNLSMDESTDRRAVDDDEISYSHIRYVNIFAILCCWCFPLTGIFTIVYSRLAKKYYDMRDKENAKKYLSKSEWLLMLTFFFGLTFIAVLLAFLDAYYFKSMSKDLHRGALIGRILH